MHWLAVAGSTFWAQVQGGMFACRGGTEMRMQSIDAGAEASCSPVYHPMQPSKSAESHVVCWAGR